MVKLRVSETVNWDDISRTAARDLNGNLVIVVELDSRSHLLLEELTLVVMARSAVVTTGPSSLVLGHHAGSAGSRCAVGSTVTTETAAAE